jgi:hypothetical protein
MIAIGVGLDVPELSDETAFDKDLLHLRLRACACDLRSTLRMPGGGTDALDSAPVQIAPAENGKGKSYY